MRKISRLFLILPVLLICLAVPTAVYADGNGRVYDIYGILNDGQIRTLDEKLKEIYLSYDVDAAVLITEGVEDSDPRQYAARFMQEYDIGTRESKDGVILMHMPASREIWIVFRGDLQDVYGIEIQDVIIEDCKTHLREDEFYEAYDTVIQELSNSLSRAREGKPVRKMDLTGEGILPSIPGFAFLSFLVSAVPVGLLALFQRGKMKTIVPQANANYYVPVNGFRLRNKRDHYIRTVTTRTRRPKENDSGGGGGGGGHFTSGGESFSGSGGKY